MNTEIQRRDIFDCNIPPCNTTPRAQQFSIWEDGFRVGYINGTDDMRNNRECTESAAHNADVQDAYERGYEDGLESVLETETTKQIYELIPTIMPKECNDWLRLIGYYEKPASVKYHGTESGDLLKHSIEVAKQLNWITKRLGLKWEREESPILVGLLHDVCKCDDYIFSNNKWDYNPNKIMNGHGDKSVMMLAGHIRLTEEEMYCIRFHMGSFSSSKEEWNYYSKAVNKYPNVLYTHTADMIASQINNI